MKGQGKGEDSMSMNKPTAAKFIQKPKGNSHNFASTTSSSMGKYTEADVEVNKKAILLSLSIRD